MMFAPADPECEESIEAIREAVGPLGPTPWERFFRATRWQSSLPEVEEDVVAEAVTFEDWWGQHGAVVAGKHSRVDSGETCTGPPSVDDGDGDDDEDLDDTGVLDVSNELAELPYDLSAGQGPNDTVQAAQGAGEVKGSTPTGAEECAEAEVSTPTGAEERGEKCDGVAAVSGELETAASAAESTGRGAVAPALAAREPAPTATVDGNSLESVVGAVPGSVAPPPGWRCPQRGVAEAMEKPVAWRSVSRGCDSPVRRPGCVVTVPPAGGAARARGIPAGSPPPPPFGRGRVRIGSSTGPLTAAPTVARGGVRTIFPHVTGPAVVPRCALGPVRRRSAQV